MRGAPGGRAPSFHAGIRAPVWKPPVEVKDVIPSCAAGVPIFQALPSEGLAELAGAMRHQRFGRGELVVAAGEEVQHLIVVARGRLKLVFTTRSGREQTVRTLGPGEFLGEMALFAPARLEGDLVALEETDACLVPRAAVQAILQKHHHAALRLVESLAQRLAEAEQMIADLGLRDVAQRLAAELLRSAAGVAPGPEGALRVRMRAPWLEVAVKLGTTPESLSRRLKSLAEQGIISQAGARTIIIKDSERLRRIAEL